MPEAPALGFATPADVEEIVEVLAEASAWMVSKCCPTWSAATLSSAFVSPLVEARAFVLARSGGRIAGVCTLSSSDPIFWPGDPAGEAAYLHKLAVPRAFAGRAVTPALVAFCEGQARALGCKVLRLDCHPMLRGVYERLGFAYVDTRHVTGEPGVHMVADRLERRLQS